VDTQNLPYLQTSGQRLPEKERKSEGEYQGAYPARLRILAALAGYMVGLAAAKLALKHIETLSTFRLQDIDKRACI
jgi:hypothetical protein